MNLRQTGMQFNSISANNNYETSHRADSSNGYHQPAMAATFMGQRMYNVRQQQATGTALPSPNSILGAT